MSHIVKEPNSERNDLEFKNKTVMSVPGQEKHYKYGTIFTSEWLYVTIVGESESKIKVNCRFKEVEISKKQIQANEEEALKSPTKDGQKDPCEI